MLIMSTENFTLFLDQGYNLKNTKLQRDIFLQGDDADCFIKEFESFKDSDEIALNYIWDIYESISREY